MRYLLLLVILPWSAWADQVPPKTPCAVAQARHAAALETDLKDRALKLGLSVPEGRLLKPMRRAMIDGTPDLVAMARLTSVAAGACAKAPSAAGPLTRAWLRLAEGAVLCHASPKVALKALWPFANAMRAAGCPVAREAVGTGFVHALQSAPTLADDEALSPLFALLKAP